MPNAVGLPRTPNREESTCPSPPPRPRTVSARSLAAAEEKPPPCCRSPRAQKGRSPKQHARPFFKRRSRWAIALLCLLAAVTLTAGGAALSFSPSPSALAATYAQARATQDVATLQATVSQPQRSIALDVPALQQNPELPTGCESIALTNALLALGFDLEKTEIADNWLPTSDDDFVTAFMGDPHASDGHSCMAPAIVETANTYLAAQGSALMAADLTGAPFDRLLEEVADGRPVIVWCTIGLADPGDPYQVERADGRTFRLHANSHCVVISGYDLDAGTVLVSDSLVGQTSCDMRLLAKRYYELGAQAVVIS